MATTILKGRIDEVGPVTQLPGDKKTDLQYIVIFIPGYHDGFEKKGRDNHWLVQITGKKVAEFNFGETHKGKMIEANCYLDSQYLAPKNEGDKPFYPVNTTLASFELKG